MSLKGLLPDAEHPGSHVRLIFLTLLAVVAMAASVLYASRVQRTTARAHNVESTLVHSMLADLNRADAALASFALTGEAEALGDHDLAMGRLRRALADARDASADDRNQSAAVAEQRSVVEQLDALVTEDLASADRVQNLRAHTLRRHDLTDAFTTSNAKLQAAQAVAHDREDQRASTTAPLLIVALSVVFGSGAALIRRRSRRASRRAARNRAVQQRFGEAMQVSDSQAEAHGLLKAHLERSIPGTAITVLNRNNSADRIEASTALGEDSPLTETLQQARPRSCMAVRLSRPFRQGETSDEVLSCDVCGVFASETTCLPLLVGGEVIGSVLAEHDGPLAREDVDRIGISVAQSAPMLANLRNLAIAETRAATDVLTGLPNRRAVDDTLTRMLAQAGRSFDPLSIILLDLDHFKAINDTYGHDRGDEVLAAFGTRLREVLRASDFAGRSGGEEFVLFLPETDRTGAVRLAEKVRAVMRGVSVPGMDRDITASFGIASFPDDAVDAETLMRCADRALYAAKRGGRDRIESSSTGAPPAAERERSAA